MGTPSNALQAAIYAALTAHAPLTALIGTGQVFDYVTPQARPPFVVIGDDTATDWSTKTTNGWDATVTIHCWDFEKAGRKGVKAILSAIFDALHRRSLPVAGFSLIDLQSEFEQTFQDTGIEGENDHFYHGVARYRAYLQA